MNIRNVAILTLGMLVTQLSFAQDKLRFGLKAATNIGWLKGTNKTIDNKGLTMGFGYGVMGEYNFHESYAVKAELLLSNIKSKMTVNTPQAFTQFPTTDTISSLNYSYNIQYVELPIAIKFHTKPVGNMTYFGNFGFSPGFGLNARASIDGALPQEVADADPTDFKVNDTDGELFTVHDFDDKVFLLRFPLIIGGGVEYKMAGDSYLQGGLRFSNSFTDIFVKDEAADGRNNYLALSLGVLF